jgi:hypothetical protein
MVVITLHGSRWLSDEGCTEEEKVKGKRTVRSGFWIILSDIRCKR